MKNRYIVVYQDVHCYKSLGYKKLDNWEQIREFVESEDLCPLGERMEYTVIDLEDGSITERSVDFT